MVLFGALAGSLAIVDDEGSGRRSALIATSGACWVLAALSKQSAGLYFLPVLLAPVLASWWLRDRLVRHTLAWCAGAGAMSLVLLAYLIGWADLGLFWRYAVELPLSVGAGRFSGGLDFDLPRSRPPLPMLLALALGGWMAFEGAPRQTEGLWRVSMGFPR